MSRISCKVCKQPIDSCGCDRTQHIYNPRTGACMLCEEEFSPNGTGPQGKDLWTKTKTFFIRLSPFNRNVDPISNDHDIGYFEGYTRVHKKIADRRMYEDTVTMIETNKKYWPKWFWVRRAMVNYMFVDDGGDDSFNWQGCTGEKKQ